AIDVPLQAQNGELNRVEDGVRHDFGAVKNIEYRALAGLRAALDGSLEPSTRACVDGVLDHEMPYLDASPSGTGEEIGAPLRGIHASDQDSILDELADEEG